MTCDSCGSEFELTKTNKIDVKNKQYVKCKNCGSIINLERDDETLGIGYR